MHAKRIQKTDKGYIEKSGAKAPLFRVYFFKNFFHSPDDINAKTAATVAIMLQDIIVAVHPKFSAR